MYTAKITDDNPYVVNVAGEVGMSPVLVKQVLDTFHRLESADSVAGEVGMSPVLVKQVLDTLVCQVGPLSGDTEAVARAQARLAGFNLAPSCWWLAPSCS